MENGIHLAGRKIFQVQKPRCMLPGAFLYLLQLSKPVPSMKKRYQNSSKDFAEMVLALLLDL